MADIDDQEASGVSDNSDPSNNDADLSVSSKSSENITVQDMYELLSI
jgi:hypothetical protein